MAEEIQGPILSVGASFDDLRQKRSDFRNAIAEYREEVATATTKLHDDQRSLRDADSAEEKSYYQSSIDGIKHYLDQRREMIVSAQKEITAVTQQVPSLPLKVEVTGVGQDAIEALQLVRDQFGELLGPLNGVTGRISALIETFKLLGKIGSESSEQVSSSVAKVAVTAEAQSTLLSAITKQTELFGAAITGETEATVGAIAQGELFGATLGEIATAEKAGAAGALEMGAATESSAVASGALAATMGEVLIAGTAVVSVIVAVFGAMFEAGKSTAELAHQYEILAERSGTTAKEIQGVSLVAKVSGVSVDEFALTLERLSFRLTGSGGQGAGLTDGVNKVQRSVEILIGSVKDADGAFLSPIEILKRLADQFAAMPDGVAKTALAMELFGRSGAQLIPTLNLGSGAIQQLMDRANELGISIDGQPQKMQAWQKATGELGLAWDSLLQQLGNTGVLGLVTAALEKLANVLDRITHASRENFANSIGEAINEALKSQGVDELTNKGKEQAQALATYIAAYTNAKATETDKFNADNILGAAFSSDTVDKISASVQKMQVDLKGVTDEAQRKTVIDRDSVSLAKDLVDHLGLQVKTYQQLSDEAQKLADANAKTDLASPTSITKITNSEKEIKKLEEELDKAQQKYDVLGTFSDSNASDQQNRLKALFGQIEAIGQAPQGDNSNAQNIADYTDRLNKAAVVIPQVKTLIEQLTKARETETAQDKAAVLEEERRTQQVQKTIAAIADQAQAEVKLASGVNDSAAAERLAVASKDAQVEIDKLLASAVDKRGQQLPALVALINQESDAIRANIAVKLVASDIAKTSDELQKETDKNKETIDGLNALAAAYKQGGEAIVTAEIGQKLLSDSQKIKDAQNEYDELSKTIEALRKSGADVSSGFVQGPTQSGGFLSNLSAQLDALKAKVESFTATYNLHFGQELTKSTDSLSVTLNKQDEVLNSELPTLQKVNDAYLQGATAVRAAEIELKLLQFTEAERAKQVDIYSADFSAKKQQELNYLIAEDAKTHANQVSIEAAQYSIQAVYEKTILKLEEVKNKLIEQGQSTVLIDAAIYDANNKWLKQLDDAVLKVGSLKDKFGAFFQEIILAGQDFGQKAFASISKAVDDLSTQISAFVVTGKANFKALFDSLAQSIVKSGIQSLFSQISKGISGALHIDLPGGKPDGSQGNPLYVKSVDLPTTGAITGQASAPGPLDGIVGFFKNLFGGKSSSSVGTPPFVDQSLPSGAQGPLYGAGGAISEIPQALPTLPGGTGGGSLPLGPIIGGAGVGAGIGGAIGGGVGAAGGAIAGAGISGTIAAASGTAGAASGALGVLGPIGIAIGAALFVFGAISQKIKAKTAEIAKQISAAFQTIVDQYNAGNLSLVSAIQQTEAARAQAIAQLSGRKGGQDQLATLLPQFDQEIAQLQAAQKQVLDTFNKLAVSLSFPQTVQGTIKSLQDLNDQVKQFLDAGGNAATAAQVFAASLSQIKGTTADGLLQSEQGIISAMLQENDLIKQRADLIKSTQDQINSVLFQGVLSRSQSEAQTKAQQIQTIQQNAATQLQALDDQKSALDAQIAGQAQLFGLTTDVTTLKQTQLAIEKQISAEQAVQIASEQKLLQQLQQVAAGATSVDLGGIATGQGSAGNAQLQHDQTVTNLQQQISELQVELKDASNANGYSNQDRQDLRKQISDLNAQLQAAIAAPVNQAPNTGVAAATDQTLANAISLALGGTGGLATAIATALKQIQGVILPNTSVSGSSGASFGNINIVVNGSNLTPDQLSVAIQNSLIAAYKSLQGNLQT